MPSNERIGGKSKRSAFFPNDPPDELGIPSQDSGGWSLVLRICEREHAGIQALKLPLVR